MKLIKFETVAFSLPAAKGNITNLINSSTNLNYKQKQDAVEVLSGVADDFEPGIYNISRSFTGLGTNGYRVYVTYFANNDIVYDIINAGINLEIDIETPGAVTTNTTPTTAATIPPVAKPAWTPTSVSLPAQGALSANFTTLNGVSVILPNIIADISLDESSQGVYLDTHILGGVANITNSTTNYIRGSVVNALGGTIPSYTTATLYVNGTVATSGYSVTGGLKNSIDLYATINTAGYVPVSLVITTEGSAVWVPTTTLDCSGGVRFINGSCRGFVLGPSAVYVDTTSAVYGPNDITLTASGCTAKTYIEKASFNNATLLGGEYQILNSGNNFYYNFNSISGVNPLYGYSIPSNSFTGTAGARGSNIYDALIEVTVTQPLSTATIPFKIYTPYTYALTGVPVWVQTVLPDSNNITSVTVDWGDSTTSTYTSPVSTELYFAHTYSSASENPYTITVTGSGSSGSSIITSQRFTVVNSFPSLNLLDYSKTLGVNLKMPFSREQVHIGSNEWVVADNINAALDKLQDNFNYLYTVTDAIKRAPSMSLVEWVRDLVTYTTWNNSLTGSNTYFNLSGSYNGIIPAESIVDFKSYKNGFAAPDYYNYIAYDNGLVQIRKNNYNNTLVNQLTAITNNTDILKVYSIDTNGTDLYVLASLNIGGGTTPASVYRYYINNTGSNIIPTNQVGGGVGDKDNNSNFAVQPLPNTVKVHKNNVYVGDVGNRCIKVFNSALTPINTIYSNVLSSYDVLNFDVNPKDDTVYVLGKIYAPNTPVITSVTTSTSSNNTTQYRVTWNHDGERLNQTASASANFNVWGLFENAGNYSLVDSVSSNIASLPEPRLTTYVFSSSSNYVSFKIEAIGINGVVTSGKSESKVIPNDVKFPSPYKLFVYTTESALVSTFNIPEIPSTANIKKITIDPVGIFLYILTEDYIYKYTVTGVYVNRITSPSKTSTSLGTNESIVTGFIDSSYYFYVATNKRLYKFTDIPTTEEIVNFNIVDTYSVPTSAITINSEEFITDWVYNKALKPLFYNHELLAKSINRKYVITLDGDENLISFNTRELSSTEYLNSLSATTSNYVYSNEVVSSAVVNRTLDKIYDAQEAILEHLKPEVIITPPSYTSNILGKVTAASSVIIYQYVPPEPTPPEPPAPEPLPVLFGFASADYVGNLYSNLYNGTARYGNDYTIDFSLINALSSANLIVTVYDVYTGGPTLPDPITITIKSNDVIFFAYTLVYNATQLTLPLSAILTTDSSTIAADGSAGTFGADFEISLSVGAVTTNNIQRARVKLQTTEGHLYNTTFKNSLMGTTAMSASYITLYDLIGSSIPYAGIANNTLGGYLYNNPYASHAWTINDISSTSTPVPATNPGINVTPASSNSFTVSATRITSGESELVLGLNRTVIDAPTTPSYLLSIVTTPTGGGGKPGGGYVNGTGFFPAGTVAPMFAVATYGSFGRFSQNVTTPPYGIVLSGPGTTQSWVNGPTFTGSTAPDAGGRIDGKLFIDGDRTVDVAFYHS